MSVRAYERICFPELRPIDASLSGKLAVRAASVALSLPKAIHQKQQHEDILKLKMVLPASNVHLSLYCTRLHVQKRLEPAELYIGPTTMQENF